MKRSIGGEPDISGDGDRNLMSSTKKLRFEAAGDGEEGSVKLCMAGEFESPGKGEQNIRLVSAGDGEEGNLKRSMAGEENLGTANKKVRLEAAGDGGEEERDCGNGFARLDENLLYEVLKHADARTLAVASCVNKMWHRTAEDERLWEMICTRHYANIKCSAERLRSVVLALGGFRRLHALYLSKTAPSSAPVVQAAARVPMSMVPQAKGNKRWGKDEVHLSLSLLSIRYYEKMNFANRNSK